MWFKRCIRAVLRHYINMLVCDFTVMSNSAAGDRVGEQRINLAVQAPPCQQQFPPANNALSVFCYNFS
jgi:hypothetical protein